MGWMEEQKVDFLMTGNRLFLKFDLLQLLKPIEPITNICYRIP